MTAVKRTKPQSSQVRWARSPSPRFFENNFAISKNVTRSLLLRFQDFAAGVALYEFGDGGELVFRFDQDVADDAPALRSDFEHELLGGGERGGWGHRHCHDAEEKQAAIHRNTSHFGRVDLSSSTPCSVTDVP